MRTRFFMLVAGFLALAPLTAAAQKIEGLRTNQSYVEDIRNNRGLEIDNAKAVFAAILRSLPARVKVYPTESYYYFSFHRGGVRYAGNIRLDAQARVEGNLYFTYFRSATPQHGDGDGQRAILGAADGVEIKEIRPFHWRVSHAGTSVIFELNDLSKVIPPEGVLGKSERYIGPAFDESGLGFYLSFDEDKAEFLFTLDEAHAGADEWLSTSSDKNFLMGRRTGFVFYVDKANRNRKVLIGVFGGNIELNNYYDGPFDQLPDSFIKGDSLREALLKREPELAGQIDRFGNLKDGENRVMISPYATYYEPEDLVKLSACITKAGLPVTEDCISPPDEVRQSRN